MKIRYNFFIVSLLFFLTAPLVSRAESWITAENLAPTTVQSYEPIKISSLISDYEVKLNSFKEKFGYSKDAIIYTPINFIPIQVKGYFTGKLRKLSRSSETYLENFFQTFPKMEYFKDLIHHEIQIEQDGVKYWFIMQDSLLKHVQQRFKEEKNKKEPRLIYKEHSNLFYTVWIGAHGSDHYFILNEVQ